MTEREKAELKIRIANLLNTISKSKGFNRKDLSKKLNVSEQQISKWVTGNQTPKIETLYKFAEVLDVNVGELLGEEFKENDFGIDKELLKKISCLNSDDLDDVNQFVDFLIYKHKEEIKGFNHKFCGL